MTFIALTLIAVLTVALVTSIALIAYDLRVERRQRAVATPVPVLREPEPTLDQSELTHSESELTLQR